MTSRPIPFARPWITDADRKSVLKVLEGHILTHGPQCKAFESEFGSFLGRGAHCVSVSSCMAALHLSYLHFGIGPGDEVIVAAQTHSATAHAIEWVGATPVFVDCEPTTGNVTAGLIEAAITNRTKAVCVVHFAGIPCSMPEIAAIAERNRLRLIEDCAIALGARYDGRHVGLWGDAGCFSFYPVKHITTGEGGMFVSRHAAVSEAVAKLRAFGVDRTHLERAIPGMYDVPTLGLNYRMSEMQAALGLSQVTRMPENLERRRNNFARLKEGLDSCPDIRIIDSADPQATSSHYCMSVVLEGRLAGRRNTFVARLNEAGIGTSVYYPQPVPRMTYYNKKYGYDASRYREAGKISDQSIALPVGPQLAVGDIDRIIEDFSRTAKELMQ